jgi:hypothetical protein
VGAIEAFNGTTEASGKLSGIKVFDFVDSALAVLQRFPGGFDIVTDWGQQA